MLSESKIRKIVRQVLSESGMGPSGLEDVEGDVQQLGISFHPYSLDGIYRRIDPADSETPLKFDDGVHHVDIKGVYLVELDNGTRYILLSK